MKRALVTGGTRGIGKAIVYDLVKNDYYVYFTYNNHNKGAEEILAELGADKVKPVKCSIENEDDIQNLFNIIFEEGEGIDLLVNNAGAAKDNYFAMMDMKKFDEIININLLGTVHITKKIIKKMVSKHSGVIINIASIGGIMGPEGQTNYAASKAGIIAFTKSLAREMGKYGIRVVSVSPGFVKTEMYAKVPNNIKEKQIEAVPLKRAAEPSEIASIVTFLASEKASYITGTTIVADGGLS